MEVVYCDNLPNNIQINGITGVIGDIQDLINIGFDIEGITYNDEWTVKRLLNGFKIIKNKRIDSILDYLEIDKSILNKKLCHLSKTDLKFALLAYLLINNKKNIIFDYFDANLPHNSKKRLSKICRLLNKAGFKILIVSNNLEYMASIIDTLLVVSNKKILYNGPISDFQVTDEIKPEIIKFIESANEKGANLSMTYDRRELLKDIFRSVDS